VADLGAGGSGSLESVVGTEEAGGTEQTEEAGADFGRQWPGRTLERRAERGLAVDDGQAQATNGDSGQNGNRRWPGRAGGGHKQETGGYGSPKTGSDTMLGIDKLYSIGAKGHNLY
jgi:hypothetical protein